jgi:hypothetical protein
MVFYNRETRGELRRALLKAKAVNDVKMRRRRRRKRRRGRSRQRWSTRWTQTLRRGLGVTTRGRDVRGARRSRVGIKFIDPTNHTYGV